MQKKYIEIGYGKLKKIKIGDKLPLVFIGGPCAIESRDHALKMADSINNICKKINLKWIYKSCYDKDCRSSPSSFLGIGLDKGLKILSEIRDEFGIPVVSDFSDPSWAHQTGNVCDMIQIPAYLCRQTSILKSAALTKRPILLKKGQFMSPWNMKNSVRKIESNNNFQILLADRGTFLGYNMLVNDMRSFPIMAETGYPVCYDATHSVQEPGGQGGSSGGNRDFAPILARGAAAIGVAAFFMETHENPDQAPSDGPNMIYLKDMRRVLSELKHIDAFAKQHPVTLP